MICMELSDDERIVISKFKRAKKYAKDNRQAGLEILILPGGGTVLIKAIFQDKIKVEEVSNP